MVDLDRRAGIRSPGTRRRAPGALAHGVNACGGKPRHCTFDVIQKGDLCLR